MNEYKPEYLGKVLPANDPSKMTDFVTNKYDAFTKVYNACKNQSANISDVKPIDNNSSDSLSVQIVASPEIISNIKEATESDDSVVVKDGVVTAKP